MCPMCGHTVVHSVNGKHTELLHSGTKEKKWQRSIISNNKECKWHETVEASEEGRRKGGWHEARWAGEGKPGGWKAWIKEGEEERGGWVREGRRWRRRGDRPEFVRLGESMSSGITSQNGQTQTEDRKMDVRGCTKGKGGGGGEGGRRHRHERQGLPGFEGQSEGEEDGGREGHNTTTIRHDNDKQQQQAQNTPTKS